MEKIDFLIIGQGLAGSTLACELLKRGKKIMVIDRCDPGSSSRVAAGLITPLTGKGMNPAWRQSEYLAKAVAYYRECETLSGESFFHHCEVLRIFTSEKERVKGCEKASEHDEWATFQEAKLGGLGNDHGGLLMPLGAWLDTPAYLLAIKKLLIANNAYKEGDFSEHDVAFHDHGVEWCGIQASKIIMCLGAYGLGGLDGHTWFSEIEHRSAKGEILTIRAKNLDANYRYHAKGWLAPRGEDIWKAGASYDWVNLDSETTEKGKDEVLKGLSSWLPDDVKLDVLHHEAGVRPIIRNSRPVTGFHEKLSHVGFFNGLGSKGTLMAPAVAENFASYLCGEADLDGELSLSEFTKPTKKMTRIKNETITGSLLHQAHQLIRSTLRDGETALDATMGNGHDTLFLLKCVGELGKVIAFDIQNDAVTNTRQRLMDEGVDEISYALYEASHSEMAKYVSDKVAVVMFNLGYLPSGDKAIITQSESTLQALNAAVELLQDGGILSVMCYPGHSGGDTEAAIVKLWFSEIESLEDKTLYQREGGRATTPFLLIAKKSPASE